MTPAEVNVLLTQAAMLDPRLKRVDPAERADMAEAWAMVLDDVALAAASQALKLHYRRSGEPIMPADVVALAGVASSPHEDITPQYLVEAKARDLAAIGVSVEEYDRDASVRASADALLDRREVEQ